MKNLQAHLTAISDQIELAELHLTELNYWMQRIEAAGMYCAIPTEEIKNDRYLYMRFPNGERDGLDAKGRLYNALDAKGRLYIGSKPAKIAEARRLANNRKLYERLQDIATRLRYWLRGEKEAIKYRAHQAKQWPRHHEQLVLVSLGQPAAIAEASSAPKNLGPGPEKETTEQ